MPAAIWFDGDGRPCGPGDAVTGEIEDDDGLRTYVDLRPEMPEEHDDRAPFAAMSGGGEGESVHPENADAIKGGTWDVRGLDQEPVETLFGLLAALGWAALPLAEARSNVCGLLELPSWDPAPQALKEEVYAWLVATR
jgi:hypothetical protein